VIVCDTGPLVAAALSNDSDHKPCVELFTALHAARRELLVPATVIAEVGYLLAREAGARVVATATELSRYTGQHLIAPQTILTQPCLTEIAAGLHAARLPMKTFTS
jgi:predicted nucleic acid-binding protein